ncbi:DUF928 domain-containing protein [Pseudanabaena sp. FACHB-1998]|uniref:DUF928 domain-containing protein n=1 Tax=Pseudanabaena sp. FACHB-1998 TaxID=2692858 RepID=UPI001680D1A6|nr:DUF928 domain-containing protein [Pseudanabaena sp. FACHB-1998]MBD2175362.1 DUF928 domain-containing protein [Pseudanabaena sp. FACHB-1998]
MSKSTALKSITYLSSILSILTTTDLLGIVITSHLLPSEAIAQPWLVAQLSGTKYGLGLPKTASTGGGTRLMNPDQTDPVEEGDRVRTIPNIQNSDRQMIRGGVPSNPINKEPSSVRKKKLPQLILLTPEDGARTASSQPTLYWYLHDQNIQAASLEVDNLKKDSSTVNPQAPVIGKLSISMSEGSEAITIFQADLKISDGLSSFKLPIAASLNPSKTYRWQITLQNRQQKEVTASGWIVYTPPDDNLQKSLSRALTSRDRAKIYAEAGYWFEAIDGYTRWLNFKPEDLKAINARNEILKLGFITNKNLDFDSFIALLNADATKSPVNKPL